MAKTLLAVLLFGVACGGGSTKVAPAPASVVASAANGKVSLSWAPFDGATSYLVFRKGPGDAAASKIGASPVASFVDVAVTNGNTYQYSIRAVTAAGTSGDSEFASATPSRILCVSDASRDRILALPADVANLTGDPPAFGSSTGLSPVAIDVDPIHGEIISANRDDLAAHAATANGNVAAVRTVGLRASSVAYDSMSDTLLVDSVGGVSTFPRLGADPAKPLRTLKTGEVSRVVVTGAAHGDRLLVSELNILAHTTSILVYGRTDAGDARPAATISVPDFVSTFAYDPTADEIVAVFKGVTASAIQTFSLGGGSSPVRVLQGDQTTLGAVTAVAIDPVNHRLYVAEAGRILVFPSDFPANANIAPSAVLAGPSTQFDGAPIANLAFDTARGVLVVQSLTRILSFAAGAKGDVAPLFAISSLPSGVEQPMGLAFDPGRKELLVANWGPQLTVSAFAATGLPVPPSVSRILDAGSGVAPFAPQLAVDSVHGEMMTVSATGPAIQVFRLGASGDEPPLRTIGGASTGLHAIGGLAYDAANDAIVVSDFGSVLRFPRTASGDVAPLTSLVVPNQHEASIAVDDSHGELFAVVKGGVAVYRLTDSGQVDPLRTLSGIEGAAGVIFDRDSDQVFVSSEFGTLIGEYPRTASGAATPIRKISLLNVPGLQVGGMALCN